jgi:UDP-glucose 4-epimerase
MCSRKDGMRILLTGRAGFIRSHIVDAYVTLGHDVLVVDDLSSGREGSIHLKARFERANSHNAKHVEEFIRVCRLEFVNHHAAQVDVRQSAEDPIFDAEVNGPE